ncbi:O-antigen polymerase [Thermoanaerobacterium thermosaccharolyticum]|uniref:O-antigen polymerase n=1 Tax=Thermoanaerobacterium thermosaccharolyticum TaxID=1517 RepID=UPI001782DCB2|nr:O-antigen polymerase [Thermoanaerobacterium thermosaccharolyticum]MBE0067691.1 oligosaccharide repeat unit polymerase [Thermoanaerobacterium thermosaccharolyticum]MBE0228514.1 oligosaccharide repeat unit polymerase [Thermoanaerobacterium thermosaccharolyticum]
MYGLIITFILILLLIIEKILIKNWINPAYIMIAYWSIFIVSAIIAFGTDFNWNYLGLIWIIFAIIIFLFGQIIGSSFAKNKILYKASAVETNKILSNASSQFIFICIIIGLLKVLIEVVANGFSVHMFFHINSLINMNTYMAQQRYYGGISYSIIMQIMLIFVYAAPLCGGYSFVYAEKKSSRLLSFATFIPIIGELLLTNGKAGMIGSAFLWFSGYFVAYVEKYKKSPRICMKILVKVVVVIVFLFSLLYFSMLLRIGNFSIQTRDLVTKKFLVYALGSIPAFDEWFSNYFYNYNPSYSLGTYTFIGLFNLLGISLRKQGVFSDIVVILNGYTNVFTAFRGIILDYGMIGGLIFVMLFGIIAGYSFRIILKRSRSTVIHRVLLSSIYFFIMQSVLGSAWAYLSYILAFFVFSIYLWLADREFELSFKLGRRKMY